MGMCNYGAPLESTLRPGYASFYAFHSILCTAFKVYLMGAVGRVWTIHVDTKMMSHIDTKNYGFLLDHESLSIPEEGVIPGLPMCRT